jgi:hypothetical protein
MTQQTPTTTPTEAPAQTEADWRLFIHKHKGAFTAFIAAGASLVAWAVYMFVWYTGNIQAVGLVPSTLALWTMDNVVTFIIHAIFWMLTLVGIPAAVGAIAGWAWWKRIPEAEKPRSGKHSKGRDAGGGASFLLFIAFAIKVYIDGNWHTAIASWNVDYVVGSMVTILIWAAAILAIPAIIGLAWWINNESKQP